MSISLYCDNQHFARAYGDDLDEMEAAALAETRALYGTEVTLELQRPYTTHKASPGGNDSNPEAKTHFAHITVIIDKTPEG